MSLRDWLRGLFSSSSSVSNEEGAGAGAGGGWDRAREQALAADEATEAAEEDLESEEAPPDLDP